MQGIVMYRNTNLVPSAPSSYDALYEWAKAVDGGEYEGIVSGYQLFNTGGHLYGMGGRLMDEEGYPAFNNSNGLAWLEMIQEFTQVGWVDSYSTVVYEADHFSQGRAGFLFDGTWNLGRYRDNLGSGGMSVDPWPAPLSGFVWTENIYANLQADADVDTQKIALAFMKFMLSDTAQQILAEAGGVPTLMDPGISDPLLEQAMAALAGATPIPYGPFDEAYWGPLDDVLRSFIYGELSAQEALDWAEEEVYARIY
jgi:ABC-type glycerol-3-phosphate transport system substrate-binding protein